MRILLVFYILVVFLFTDKSYKLVDLIRLHFNKRDNLSCQKFQRPSTFSFSFIKNCALKELPFLKCALKRIS